MFLVSVAVPLRGHALVYMAPSNFSVSTYHTVAYDSPQSWSLLHSGVVSPSSNMLYSYRLIRFLHFCMYTVYFEI